MQIETWATFAVLWVAVAAFPGPNAAFSMAVGSRRGAAAAIAAAAGFSFGVICYVTLVGLGLIAFIAASAQLFEVLRWVGVVYLFYLAWQSWRSPTEPAAAPVLVGREAGSIFAKAALITLTNPKSALTYVLVYPAFMDGAADPALQLVILGATSTTLSFLNYTVYGVAAGQLGRLIKTRRQAMFRNRFFASIFASAGLALAWAERK